MSNKVGIYSFLNKTNNKRYIGQSIDLDRRYSTHISESQNNKSSEFYKDLYYLENFQYDILEICKQEDLNDREKYWISFYNSVIPYGYNLTNGGSGASAYIKYNAQEREEIIQLIIENKLTLEEIAEKYEASIWTIYSARNGKIWYNEKLTYPLRPDNYFQIHEKEYCSSCGVSISKNTVNELCLSCYHKHLREGRPTRDELLKLVYDHGFAAVGRKYGVTDNAIRKWCKTYGLPHLKSEIVALYKIEGRLV